MMCLHTRLFSAAALLVGLLTGQALAQVGEVVAVTQNATATNEGTTRTLEEGSAVDIGDLIETSGRGLVQIRFNDDTKLVVGNNSRLVVDTYLLESGDNVRDMTLDALGGTFRFFTGRSAKQAYKIKTTVATIGVRGTEFDWTNDDDHTSVVNFGGFPFLQSNSDPSLVVLVRRLCFPTTMRADNSVNAVNSVAVRNEQIIREHPLIRRRQSSFAPGFRQPIRVCGDLRRVNNQPTEDNIGNESTPPSFTPRQPDIDIIN